MLFLINTYNGKYKFRYGHSVGQIKKITKKGLQYTCNGLENKCSKLLFSTANTVDV